MKGGGFRAALSMGDLIADLSNVTLQVGGGDLNLLEKDTRNCRLEKWKVKNEKFKVISQLLNEIFW